MTLQLNVNFNKCKPQLLNFRIMRGEFIRL